LSAIKGSRLEINNLSVSSSTSQLGTKDSFIYSKQKILITLTIVWACPIDPFYSISIMHIESVTILRTRTLEKNVEFLQQPMFESTFVLKF